MPQFISGLLVHLALAGPFAGSGSPRKRDDRGDVPGWVMVTLMTAIVIAGLTPFVGQELTRLLGKAFAMVGG